MSADSGASATSPVIVSAYFARWRRHDTGRWSRIHWFRDGTPACGRLEPLGACDLDLPPEPILTCVACQSLNQKMQAADAGRSQRTNPPVPDNDTIFGPPRHREQAGECTRCGQPWPCPTAQKTDSGPSS